MLCFNSSAEEEATLELFDLISHAKRHELIANISTFERILTALGLDDVGAWVFEVNPSSSAPYHGTTHEMLMTCYAFMGCAVSNVPWADMRALVTAACMHDYDHTGVYATLQAADETLVATDDSLNISRALDGLSELKLAEPQLFCPAGWTKVARLINCTRYPYLAEPADLLEELMRDADLCMPYVASPTREELFHGLRRELDASGRVYTLEAFADGVVAFYQASKRYTPWAEAYAEKHNLMRSVQELSANLRIVACRSSTEGM